MLPLPPGGAPHLFVLMVIAALIGGLSAIERKGAFQLMLSRPIVLAPLLGWALGDAQGGLVLGIPLELLFLGGVNLGGSLPDNESLLAGALTSMVVSAGLSTRARVVLPSPSPCVKGPGTSSGPWLPRARCGPSAIPARRPWPRSAR